MNPFAIPPFLAAVLNLGLLVWVYRDAAPGPVRRSFLWWNSTVAVWNLGIAVGYLLGDAQSLIWYRWVIPISNSFIAPTFVHFATNFTESSDRLSRRVVLACYLAGGFFAVTGAGTSLMIGPIVHYFWGPYPLAGRLVWLFDLLFPLMVGYAFYRLIHAVSQTTGRRRNQLYYLIGGAAIGFSSGITNFLPLYGIGVYPVGNLFNSLYSVLVAYAIVEYGLMDIRVVLRRALVYGVLSGTLTGVYLSIISVFKRLFGYYGLEEHYLYYTAAMPVTIVLAPMMKAHIEPWIERAPFWKTYRYSEIFHEFAESVVSVLDLPAVASRIVEKMCSLLLAESGAVYLTQPPFGAYVRVAYQGREGPPSLTDDHPVIASLSSQESEFVKEKALWGHRFHERDPQDAPARELLEAWPYALALPLKIKGQLLGIVALGEKTSGDMFNTDDLNLLKALSRPAAAALSNASSFAEIERRHQALRSNQDTALMGILAMEMAHELAKPLTHILNEESRLEPAAEGASREGLRKIEKEAQRAADILGGFAMLSPHQPLQRAPVDLSKLLEEALETLGLSEEPRLRIERLYETLPSVAVNRSQLLQVFTNILQNARHAMPAGGQLVLSLKASQSGAKVEISVTDSGPGIAGELQAKIFEPFFTTKQSQGGRGVGLTISRAMVERHGGTIRIESPVKGRGGTRVIIALPVVTGEGSHV